MKPSSRRLDGFTLIELMITVAIVVLLATVAVPVAETVTQRNKEQELRTALRQIRGAIDAYKDAATEGKVEVAAGTSGYPKTLESLVEGVVNKKDPSGAKIYFLRRLPRDPMAPDPKVEAEKTWGLRSYKSPPDSPQEGDDVFDVYSRSTGVGLNGVPYRQW